MYAMVYAMWGGKAGTMGSYTPTHLHALGVKLGKHFRGWTNVILVAGGESTPSNVDEERVNAMGSGLKDGCAGQNLVTVHPRSNQSASLHLSKSPWLDFYLSQVQSGRRAKIRRHFPLGAGFSSAIEVPTGEDFYEMKNVPYGEIRDRQHFSKSTYTLPGYDQNSSAHYPLLYLQHGGETMNTAGPCRGTWVRSWTI
jgi:hypothetical protein